jgi:molybdopterin converting factor subunit 1
MNTCKVLFFATLKDRAGVRQAILELPAGMSVGELKVTLAGQYPALRPLLQNVLVAVNREYARDDVILPPTAEIAIFPPVSGGGFILVDL